MYVRAVYRASCHKPEVVDKYLQAYWGFVMMSFHLGLHVRTISVKVKSHMSKAVRMTVTVLFLLDYAAIMVLVADIAYWIQTGLTKFASRRRSEGDRKIKS